ncbi:MAG TPA: ferric reductase-like transmembrane domain-containing protein [Actinomycetota bacterium]|nr:ferric reductase-like transmembrane domain-containing protein [Actinomycetota bacterium]
MARTSTAHAAPRPGRFSLPRPVSRLPQPLREGLVFAVVAAGGAMVLFLWWHDTLAASLNGMGADLTAAGRITGLLGTYLVLVEVVLMGRVRWLDQLIGMDRLAVWHKRNGFYAVWLLVAHALLTIWGYAVSDHASLAHETGVVVLSYPDVLTATFALLLLILIGVVGARAARRRLRFETWYFIHLYTYLAIALSFAHVFATGNDFINYPANRAFWIALYVIAFGNLFLYRVAIPLRNAARHRMRVANVVAEAPGVVSIYIAGQNLDDLRAEAGQFFLWRFLTREGWWEAHPFSLSAAPTPNWLRIMVKSSGDFTARLQSVKPGTRVFAEGPYGAFTQNRRTRRKVLLIGGGVGVAPVRALLESLSARRGDLTLLYRASREEDLAFRAEIDQLADLRGAKVHYLLGPRRKRANSFDPQSLRHLVPDIAAHDVYLCGPAAMREQATAGLVAAGVPKRRIHVENFEL